MLKLKNIHLSRGQKLLLDDASVQLNAGYRAGLIGRNGTGKSSLMKFMLGDLVAQGGEIEMPADYRLGYLDQELPESKASVIDYTCQGDDQWYQIQQQLQRAEAEDNGMIIGELHARLEQIDGYRVEQRASRVLRGLGFTDEQMHHSLSEFSGGWQMRVQLARVLMTRSDLLLLDEPTNHLDLESIIWLESWLAKYTGIALIISHDRDFLDAVTTHIVHLTNHTFKLYQGNYSSFSKQFTDALLLQAKANEKVIRKRAHMQSFVDRFRAKASKAKQAQSRMKALEKLQTSASMQEDSSFSFTFFPCEQVSYPALHMEGKLGYPDRVVLPWVEMSVAYGDRIGIVGRNGEGKTTLLKTLSGQLSILEGQIGSNPKVKVGYFSQQQLETLSPDESAYMQLKKIAKDKSESELRNYLGRFAFSNDRIFEDIGNFSGGEKSRLALALLIWQRPNVLILDEPTNHLDMVMREALILALQQYEGAVLLVSHDRYLLQTCVNELILVHDGQAQRFAGSCDDYSELVLSYLNPADKEKDAASAPKKKNAVPKGRLKKMEKQIESLQKKLETIDQQLADPALYAQSDVTGQQELQAQRDKVAEKLAQVEETWLRSTDS